MEGERPQRQREFWESCSPAVPCKPESREKPGHSTAQPEAASGDSAACQGSSSTFHPHPSPSARDTPLISNKNSTVQGVDGQNIMPSACNLDSFMKTFFSNKQKLL